MLHGQVTVGVTAVTLQSQLPSGIAAKCNKIYIKAHPSNSGIVYVGVAGVTTGNGWPLSNGQEEPFEVNNPSLLSFIGSASGQLVAWRIE